jgi:beta-carotene hydroxylase
MLRFKADLRTLAYLAATGLVLAVNWRLGVLHPLLYPLQLFLFFTTAVISHNHNHLSIWRSRAANLVTSWVISIFYGYPAIGWVPTHNQVHHKLNNAEGDSSRCPKVFKGNHLLAIIVYPTLTSLLQTREVNAFMVDLWRRKRRAFWSAASEFAVFYGVMVAAFLIDWRKALLFLLIPQQVALFAIQAVNFLQHIETATGSDWNHSRNFVSPVLNAILFNNGYHTVHHMKPGVHWSQTPALDAEVARFIDPSLREPSLLRYLGYTYFVRPFTRAPAPALRS